MDFVTLLSSILNLILSGVFTVLQATWLPQSHTKVLDTVLLFAGIVFTGGYILIISGYVPVSIVQIYGFRPAVSLLFAGLIAWTYLRKRENG